MELPASPPQPRLLVVDDDASNLVIAQSLLGHHGCYAHCCSDFAAARKALQSGQFDLALLDIHMPEGSGAVLSLQLQKIQPSLKCIAFTADGDYQEQHDYLQGRFAGLLVKPISSSSLAQLLSEHQLSASTHPDPQGLLSTVATLPTGSRERYVQLLIKDISQALTTLRGSPSPLARQQALHSLVGVLGTAGADCYPLALAAETLDRQQQLPASQLDSLLKQIDTLLLALEQQHR